MRLFEITKYKYNTNLLKRYKDEVNFALDKYNQDIVIYRGSYTYNKNIMYIDPTSRTTDRKSANTYNYYTLWMDNDPEWTEYPKRSKSLICSTTKSTASAYGTPVVVVPLTNCKIGICPYRDLWNSFKSIPILNDLTGWIHHRFELQWVNDNNIDLTYIQLIQKLKDITEYHNKSRLYSELEELLKMYGNAYEVMREIMNPIENNFSSTTWKQFDIGANREVWLSAPCLLINPLLFDQLAMERKNETL